MFESFESEVKTLFLIVSHYWLAIGRMGWLGQYTLKERLKNLTDGAAQALTAFSFLIYAQHF